MENTMNTKEAATLNAARTEIKALWEAACIEANVPTDSKFVCFSETNRAAVIHNQAMGEFMKLRNRILRNSQRRARHAAIKDLGLNRVVGNLGTVYFE